MQIGKIKMNKNTEGHRALLEGKGYSVTEESGHLEVQCNGFHEELVNLTTEAGKRTVKEVVEKQLLFTYKTKFVIPGYQGQFSGIFACSRLGSLSCLIAKDKAKTKKKKNPAMKSLLDDLGF